MLKIDAGDSNVAIQITPVDASGVNIGLTGATNPVYAIRPVDGSTRKTVAPAIDAGHVFFTYNTTPYDFPKPGFFEIQPQWTDASGGQRSSSPVTISVEPRK